MLKNFTLSSLLLTTLLCNAQTPDILQQRCLGGSGFEGLANTVRAQVTKDSGYIIITNTRSEDGDVSGLHPADNPMTSHDIWVVKLNQFGGIQWQKCLGGSGPDIGYAIDTADGSNYFITGFTQSTNGDIGVARASTGDAWVAKLGSTGNIIWKNCIGGSRADEPRAIRSTPDGGCIMAGYTYSNDGDVNGNHITSTTTRIPDAWAVKLSANGTIEWSKCYGSTASDVFRDVLVTKDGNYLLAGSTFGKDGDVSGNHSDAFATEVSDGWAVKVDRSGKIIWAYCYGGNYIDGFAKVRHAADGGYIFAGNSQSASSEQVLGSHGNNYRTDAWLLKTNADGGFQWGRCYGGVWEEWAVSVAVRPDGYWFVGDCQLNHDDVQGPDYEGGYNIWLGQVSLDGKLVWQRKLGGDKEDNAGDVLASSDGYPVVIGITNSEDGDIKRLHKNNINAYDIWWAKLSSINSIHLNGFGDLNNNNVKDPGEPFFAQYNAEVYRNNVLVEVATAERDTLKLIVDTGKLTILPLAHNNYYKATPASIPASFSSYFNTLKADIAFKPTGSFSDLTVKIIPITGRRRGGMANQYRVLYENVGTNAINAPQLKLVKDARMNFVIASATPVMVVQDTLLFNINAIPPLTQGFIDVTLRNSTALLINDTVSVTASILPVATDATAADNVFELREVIIGSYDPNDKMEAHGGNVKRSQVANGEYLNYTIRFQNTGNDTAYLVTIRDTLSSKYEANTLKMIAASHRYVFELKNNICTWTFNDINLVDSLHNEPGSHGFVSFQIKAKSSTPQKDTIKNKAAIYFDYNPPVITNTHQTVVRENMITGIEPITAAQGLKIFPNPVTEDWFMVQSSAPLQGNVFVELYNGAGALVQKQFVGKSPQTFAKQLSIKDLPCGQYLVIVRTDNRSYFHKLLKIK